MKQVILSALYLLTCMSTLQASNSYSVKRNTSSSFGEGFGKGFAESYNDSLRRQQEIEQYRQMMEIQLRAQKELIDYERQTKNSYNPQYQ